MKIIKRSSIILVLILSISYLHAQKSFNYSSDEGKFSIKFPGEYTETVVEKETAKTVKNQCEKDGINYLASYTLHYLEITDHLDMAEVSLESFTEAVQGIIITRTEWKVKKHEGLRALIDLPDNGKKLEYRVILVGNIQYQLIAFAANDIFNEDDINSYFKSFKLMK